MRHDREAAVRAAFVAACRTELLALKPGNVHVHGPGGAMTVEQFELSAVAAAPHIAASGFGVGGRILEAVDATQQAVGRNTNLGIILLAAPLAEAALAESPGDLRRRLGAVLEALTVEDADLAYEAIRRAGPGGLGRVARYDIAEAPGVTLLVAMREAAARDRIAWQYAHGFADVFEIGIPCFEMALARWRSPVWAASHVFLTYLAAHPDTLIARKFGAARAAAVSAEAAGYLRRLEASDRPEAVAPGLMAFDASLKSAALNPGTSADLTVAALFARALASL